MFNLSNRAVSLPSLLPNSPKSSAVSCIHPYPPVNETRLNVNFLDSAGWFWETAPKVLIGAFFFVGLYPGLEDGPSLLKIIKQKGVKHVIQIGSTKAFLAEC